MPVGQVGVAGDLLEDEGWKKWGTGRLLGDKRRNDGQFAPLRVIFSGRAPSSLEAGVWTWTSFRSCGVGGPRPAEGVYAAHMCAWQFRVARTWNRANVGSSWVPGAASLEQGPCVTLSS